MKETYNSISIYDKTDNLIRYAEFNGEEPSCYYKVDGNTMTRRYTNEYDDEEEGSVSEVVNSVIKFEDNIMLFPFPIEGETSLRAVASGESFSLSSVPTVSSRIDTYVDTETNYTATQNFTIKPDLIDEWVSKL